MAGAAEEKPTKGEAPLPPPPTLWSSNSLILNLRLPPPPPPHPILTTQTRTHAQFMQLHWLPSSHPQAMNGQTGTKPNSSPLRKSNHWV